MHAIWIRELATWAYLSSFLAPSYIFFLSHPSSCVHDKLFSPANKDTEKAGTGLAERRHEWYLSSVCRSLVITHKTLRDPCCHRIDFLQWPAATTEPFTWPPTKDEVWVLLVARLKICSGTGKCTPINHTSVVSWMHTNLYVLELCGRSNLTKIHTSLSSWSWAVINENYLRKKKWTGEKKREDRAGGGR